MSSVGLSDIPRTTSFRLALLFLGLFGTASLGVFGFLYWQTAGYLASGLDDWLGRELTARSAEHSSELRRQLDAHTLLDPAGRRPFALFDSLGNWVGGNRRWISRSTSRCRGTANRRCFAAWRTGCPPAKPY